MDLHGTWREQQRARMPAGMLERSAGAPPLAGLDARIAAILTPCLLSDGILRPPGAARGDELGALLGRLGEALARPELDPESRAYLERLRSVGEAVLSATRSS